MPRSGCGPAPGKSPEPAAAQPRTYGAPRKVAPDHAGAPVASWSPSLRGPVQVRKDYLADAAFLAGLTTNDPALAERITAALNRPRRLPFLGRRNCPPAHPVAYGVTDHGPDQWPTLIPLLPEATTATPTVWTETPPRPGSRAFPEQPPTSFQTRDHRTLHLSTSTVRPPAAAPGQEATR
jgi:CRISPR system Cascade subunit CasD